MFAPVVSGISMTGDFLLSVATVHPTREV